MFSLWTTAFRNLCGVSAGTYVSSYIQLCLSFLMSGLGHAASALILPSPENITVGERTWGLVLFFVWQACVLTNEDGIIYLWRRTTNFTGERYNTILRIADYAWVVCMLWYSIGWAGDVFLHLRLSEFSCFHSAFALRCLNRGSLISGDMI